MNRKEYQHLINRAGFGCTLQQLHSYVPKSRAGVVDELFSQSANPHNLEIITWADVLTAIREYKGGTADDKKKLRKLLVEKGKELNTGWLRTMINGPEQLNEKMTFFWHCHFACRDDNPYFLQQLNNAVRQNALGNFKTLVNEVARSPAMLKFLNNQQNKKDAPNENFARELMELFTLGRGNYTENDVKEAARAFTGWSFERDPLTFKFKANQHDYGDKTFFGKTGNFYGKDVIDMIVYREECAHFIAGKLYTFFVNDTRDESKIKLLAEKLYMSDYDIAATMKEIFMADWFYEPQNIGAKIKSPVELLVGTARLLNATFDNDDILIVVQKVLDQVLFVPPNVAGWPGGKRWIDNSNLIFRMEFGRKVIESSDFNARLKADDDTDPNMMMQQERQKDGKLYNLGSKVNWDDLTPFVIADNEKTLFDEACTAILCTGNVDSRNTAFRFESNTGAGKLKEAVYYLMSRLEYQLC